MRAFTSRRSRVGTWWLLSHQREQALLRARLLALQGDFTLNTVVVLRSGEPCADFGEHVAGVCDDVAGHFEAAADEADFRSNDFGSSARLHFLDERVDVEGGLSGLLSGACHDESPRMDCGERPIPSPTQRESKNPA